MLIPEGSPTFKGIRSENFTDRIDFISLMLALFAGTASLPHILIRYYTVKDAASARKSTAYMKLNLDDQGKTLAGKIAAVVVGIIAMVLGVVFQHLNVGFLVGWALNVAASANLPAFVMLLFWRGTTKQGITASILVGLTSSLMWLLLSAPAYKDVYGLHPARAHAPFTQPGIVTIPLAFITLVVVSLLTRDLKSNAPAR